MPEPDPDDLLTVKELIAKLNIDAATWWRWRKFGDAPVGIRLGATKGLRFKWSEVQTWLETRREQAS